MVGKNFMGQNIKLKWILTVVINYEVKIDYKSQNKL
jgi:hypothetical protein